MGHSEDLHRFYTLLDRLASQQGVPRLKDCNGKLPWPKHGVYFFLQDGEHRKSNALAPRIVRVGTHALKPASGSSLWTRLSQHRGQQVSGGGNHRGSIFRLLVGNAFIRRSGLACPTWGQGNTVSGDIRKQEYWLEQEVSSILGNMRVIWLAVDDPTGPNSDRGKIERHAIALLSTPCPVAQDIPSSAWLGHDSDRVRVQSSGLWNSNHVGEEYRPGFLDVMEQWVTRSVA